MSQRKGGIRPRRLELLFRIVQIHQGLAEEAVDHILPSIIITAEVLIITTLYCLIHLYAKLPLFLLCLLVCVSLVASVVLIFGVLFAVRETEYSEKYIALGRSIRLEKSEQLFLRSCRPLQWKIGSTFVLSRGSLLTIYQDIIVTCTINLLLTFK